MAITNLFSIKYGDRTVGGDSNSHLLHGPYVLDRSFNTLRLVFDVVVVASSYGTLQSLSDDLEVDFRKRDQSLIITLDLSVWTYTFGTDILNSTSSISKTGDPETDRGFSRAYTVVIEGELPADDAATGLREIEWNVDYESGRQRIVTSRGVYTATTSQLASVNYLAAGGADAEATTFLAALSGSASYELVDENFTPDRNDHLCTFTRQYVELLANQVQATLDATDIRDHRMVFTDLSQHPGDSQENVYRLRRVVGTYDCAIDIVQTTNLQAVFDTQVRPHVIALFESNFNPQVFAVEDRRVSYDETTKRLSVSMQFIYQKDGGDNVVEVSQSVAYREARNIDYTPVHDQGEFVAEADVGWATRERVWSRTVIVIGDEFPKRRIGEEPKEGPAGPFDTGVVGEEARLDTGDRKGIVREGWNIVQNTSQVTDQWIGDPDETLLKVSILSETVVERFHQLPGPSTRTPLGPIAGRQ